MEFYILELPKLPKELQEDSGVKAKRLIEKILYNKKRSYLFSPLYNENHILLL